MVWTQADYDSLIADSKDLMVDLAQIIAIKMTLGENIDNDLDLLEYASNMFNGLKYGVLIYQDEHFDYMKDQITTMRIRCRKYLQV